MAGLGILLHEDLYDLLLVHLGSGCRQLALCSKALNDRYGEESLNWKDYESYKKAARYQFGRSGWSSYVTSLVFDSENMDRGQTISIKNSTFWGLESAIVKEAQRLNKVAKRFQVMMEFKMYYPIPSTIHGISEVYLPMTTSWISQHRIRAVSRYRMYVNPLQRAREATVSWV